MTDTSPERFLVTIEFDATISREYVDEQISKIGGRIVSFERIGASTPDEEPDTVAHQIDIVELENLLPNLIPAVVSRVWNVGWEMAQVAEGEALEPADDAGHINLRNVLKHMRDFEDGHYLLHGVSGRIWDSWAEVIGIKLADDPETEDALVLNWDKSIHDPLVRRGIRASSAAIAKLKRAYEISR